MTLDLLSIRLTAVGFPPAIRLSVPDAFARVDFGAKKEAWALISVSSTKLMTELVKTQHRDGYPNDIKLQSIRNAVQHGASLEAPMLEFHDSCSAPNFVFFDGRHRITVLVALGAETIPVCVPWHRADELIQYFS